MTEIKFDLGKDIVETARASGVPQFDAKNYGGYIMYDISGFGPEVRVRFARPDHEIIWSSVFALGFSAFEARQRQVHRASLQLSNETLQTHEAARAFVEQTVAQFQKGKWKRYIRDGCPAVTGRSSILDVNGQLTTNCSVDPEYKLTHDDWIEFVGDKLLGPLPTWEWIGDGIYAELEVQSRLFPAYNGDTPNYYVALRFEINAVREETAAKNLAREIEQAKADGVDLAARNAEGDRERAALIKILEANAIARGDRVVER